MCARGIDRLGWSSHYDNFNNAQILYINNEKIVRGNSTKYGDY